MSLFGEHAHRLEQRVERLEERMEHVTTQLETLNAALDQAATDFSAGLTAIQDELNQIAAGNPGIDLSGPLAKVQALDTSIQGLADLKPEQPAPSPSPSPTPASSPTQSVYVFTGTGTPDPASWPARGFETAEATPRPLYYFSGDTAPGQTNGNGLDGGAWAVYTGAVQAVPASS